MTTARLGAAGGQPASSPVRRFGMPGVAGLRSRGEAAAGFWKARKSGHHGRAGRRGRPAPSEQRAAESGEGLKPSFLCAPPPAPPASYPGPLLHPPMVLGSQVLPIVDTDSNSYFF